MKYTLRVTAVVLLLTLFVQAQDRKAINTDKSTIVWKGKKVTGSHEGTLQFKSGEILLENGKLKGGNFTVDMSTLVVTDLETGDGKEKLEGHLNSDDFFGTSNHPQATLVITDVVEKGSLYKVTGDLTIKNITQPIVLEMKANETTASTEVKIDRTKFDIKYGSGNFFDNLGDKMINDDFVLNVNLVY